MRTITVVAYFLTAGACILIGLTAKNNAKRAAPMLVLLLLRFFVVLARLLLNSGSWWASINFLWMEVRSPNRKVVPPCVSARFEFTMCRPSDVSFILSPEQHKLNNLPCPVAQTPV